MSDDRKKAFWFIALLSVLVILPFLGETIFFFIPKENHARLSLHFLCWRVEMDTSGKLWN